MAGLSRRRRNNMKIQIIDPCMELQRAGIKPGDVVEANPGPASETGAMFFEKHNGCREFQCVVYPDNYTVVCQNPIK